MSAEFPRVPRVWADAVFSPGRFGIVHPNLPWHDVMQAYYWDNLRVAMSIAEDAGIGFNADYLSVYRMIEAEHVTREEGSFYDYGDWLLLEFVPDATGLDERDIQALVRQGCDQVADTFGYSHGPAVLFSMLHPATDAPYVPGRHGFFVDKYPFDKVCLPSELLRDEDEFLGAVRHEYSHAMCLNRTVGKCPVWLHEAVASVAEGGRHRSRERPSVWRNAVDLNSAFRAEREDEEGSRVVRDAYAQSAVIGRYLAADGGPARIGRLLDAFTDNSFLQNLVIEVSAQRPEDEALRQVYGFGVKQLFKDASP